jgi:hypothetical protein
MALGGNTWQKKLMAKQKRHILRARYGSMVPLAERIRRAKAAKLRVLDMLVDLDDETIKPPKTNQERADKDKRAPLKDVMVAGWAPKPWGKKIAARAVVGYTLVK